MARKTITRADLCEAVYQKVGLSRTESATLVELVLKEITDCLERGETVKLSSFGSFVVRKKGQRVGRNPKTGKEVPISPRRVMVFKPSAILKHRINAEPNGGDEARKSAHNCRRGRSWTKPRTRFAPSARLPKRSTSRNTLRFWESRFSQIRPLKRGGGRRYYRPEDIDLLRGVRHLLYGEGYTIRGVQRILREEGLAFVQSVWRSDAQAPPPDVVEVDDEEESAPVKREAPRFFAKPSSLPLPSHQAPTTRQEPVLQASAPPQPRCSKLTAPISTTARRSARSSTNSWNVAGCWTPQWRPRLPRRLSNLDRVFGGEGACRHGLVVERIKGLCFS